MADPSVLLAERYVLRDDAGADPGVDDPAKHYGVWDNIECRWAIVPSATLCWGLEIDAALDALHWLRTGHRPHSTETGLPDA